MHLIDMQDSCITCFSLSTFIRYFKKELLTLGAIQEADVPQYLSSWIDKNSLQCIYTVFLVRYWSIAYLRACCWYIECGKTFCPVEEEDAKKACDQADSIAPVDGEVQEDEVEVDLSLLPEKERNKILNLRERDAERAKAKANREAQKVKDKEERDAKREAKKGGRSGKSKACDTSTPTLVLLEASTRSMSQNPRKLDSSFVQLSVSRLQ